MEDFRNAAVVQAGLGGYLARRKACLPCALEAFSAGGAGLVSLTLSLIELSLETPHLGSGLLLGGIHDGPQPKSCRGSYAVETSRSKELLVRNATRM